MGADGADNQVVFGGRSVAQRHRDVRARLARARLVQRLDAGAFPDGYRAPRRQCPQRPRAMNGDRGPDAGPHLREVGDARGGAVGALHPQPLDDAAARQQHLGSAEGREGAHAVGRDEKPGRDGAGRGPPLYQVHLPAQLVQDLRGRQAGDTRTGH